MDSTAAESIERLHGCTWLADRLAGCCFFFVVTVIAAAC
jgi:hypothetical protein